jgi:hypothetical protein
MSYRSSFSLVIIDQYLTELCLLDLVIYISEVKFAAGGILVLFRGRHLVVIS